MSISKYLVLSYLIVIIVSTEYRVVIIENGYNFHDKTNKKLFAAMLFENTSNYQIPKHESKTNIVIDNSSEWKLLDFKESLISDFSTSNISETYNFELPIKNIELELSKFGSRMDYEIDRDNTYRLDYGRDKSNPFFLFEFNSELFNYYNIGFSLFMTKTEFSFVSNVYFVHDFKADPSKKVQLEFKAKSTASFSILNEEIKFILKLKYKTENSLLEDENFIFNNPNISFYENEQDNLNKLVVSKSLNLDMTFKISKDENQNSVVFKENLFLVDDDKPIKLNIYCELIVDGIKRYFLVYTIDTEDKNGKQISSIGNTCFLDQKFQKFSKQNNPFRRIFSESKISVLGKDNYNNGEINTLIITIVATSARNSRILI